MAFSKTQHGVLRGMAGGALVAVSLILCGAIFNPFGYGAEATLAARLSIAVQSGAFAALFLAVAIGRLAKHRFFTPEDIDGGGLSAGSEQARLLQSLLQNTLEQTTLAVVVYAAWAVAMPGDWLSVVPLAALAFGLGRILFFRGYRQGAAARALGFTLGFYPSLGMLACVLVMIIRRATAT